MGSPVLPPGPFPVIPLDPTSAYGIEDPNWWDAFARAFAEPSHVSDFLASGRALPRSMRGVRFRHHSRTTGCADSGTRPRQGVAIDFGSVDVSSSALREAPPRIVLYVVSNGGQSMKVSNAIIYPVEAPFRVADFKAGAVLSPTGAIALHVQLKPESIIRNKGVIGQCQAWLLVELEMGSVSAGTPITWNIMRSVIGSEVRANLVNLKWSRSFLNAEAEPFFPSQFAKCFDPANEPMLPRLMDEDEADELVPEGFRRVEHKLPRPVIFLLPEDDQILTSSAGPEDDQILTSSAGPEEPRSFLESFAAEDDLDASPLSLERYKQRMQLALRLEAMEMFEDIKRYDICGAFLKRVASAPFHVKLQVPGLSESRPALVLFDPVRLRPVDQDLLPFVELIARVVHIDPVKSLVTLRLPAGYRHNARVAALLENPKLRRKAQFHVRFCTGNHYKANRNLAVAVRDLTLAIYQRLEYSTPMSAVKAAERGLSASRTLMSDGVIAPFLDRLNSRQLEAVFMCMDDLKESPVRNGSRNAVRNSGEQATLRSTAHDVALCIFGPPGTGKTLTLTAAVAAILLKFKGTKKILATAPSQQAADVICERLIENFNVDSTAMFRFNPYERPIDQARPTTLGHVLINDGYFDLPSLSQLASFSVIVCSCTSATVLDLPADHFSAVFIDEAAQALEPEALVPIVKFASAGAKIVLCGDPHQLNAEVHSEKAAKLGLQTSLMERIMLGRYDAGNTSHIIQLDINYRANHAALLELPSRMFYKSGLHVRPGLHQWKNFGQEISGESSATAPLMIIGMASHEERVGERLPGLRNVEEACKVVEVCARLTESGQLSPSDIGVIAPYRVQVRTIRQLLRDRKLHSVKVGTVNDYQGQEGSVIVISTTLTSEESFAAEQRLLHGFVGNSSKKFNVSITRAENLLVVIGNPHVLLRDRCWSELLRYGVMMGCYTGVTFPGMESIPLQDGGEKGLVNPLGKSEFGGTEVGDESEAETAMTLASSQELEISYRDEADRGWRVFG